MLLRDWLSDKDISDNEKKKLSKHMDVKVRSEYITHNGVSFIPWSTFGTHKNVYNWILLENNLAVGWNENPAKGWSFPSKKLNMKDFEAMAKISLSNLMNVV